jgi:hypothetical protein
MTSNIFRVLGHYRGDYSNAVHFTVSACNYNQVRGFVRAFVPGFVVKTVKSVSQQEPTHYSFETVNAACSASIHLTNRRATGCAIRRAPRIARRTPAHI